MFKMKKLVFILCLVCAFTQGFASKIVVSVDIGFDVNDSTSFLELALTASTADTIVIDNVGNDWITGPLAVERSNFTLIIEPGVVIRALPGAYDTFDSLLSIFDKEEIKIVGYDAKIVMNKQEYIDLNDGEFRHGVRMGSARNVRIEGLTVEDTGGDGYNMNKSFLAGSTQNYCENITLIDCRAFNNYRQGLSIISAKDVAVLYCEFSSTNGTLPEDGIDIEPFEPDQRIENVLIKGCRIVNNYGNAIQVAMEFMDDSSQDISILVEDTFMSSNHDPSNTFAFAELNISDNGGNGVDGEVIFRNCFINKSDWTAVYVNKTVESYDLTFEQCVFKDVSNDPISFNSPIFFEVTDYVNPVARFGGASFSDCTIIYDENIPFLDLFENIATSPGLGDVTGNFNVINPNSVNFNSGIDPLNVDISFEYFQEVPETEINLGANQTEFNEEEILVWNATRTSNAQFPFAAEISFDGEAEYGLDYGRHPGFVFFPKDMDVVVTEIPVVEDQITEDTEEVVISLLEDSCYTIGPSNSISLFILDELLGNDGPKSNQFKLVPNPANDFVSLFGDDKIISVEIYDSTGKMISSQLIPSHENVLDTRNLKSGFYFLKLKTSDSNQTVKLIIN